MRTIVVGDRPPLLAQLIAERAAKGQDLFDEVWNGEYHLAPAPHSRHGVVDRQVAAILDPVARASGLVPLGPFNLGALNDYRVPDAGYVTQVPTDTFVETAAVVVEIVSPGDETFEKFDFYFAQSVLDLVIVDPVQKRVQLFTRNEDRYEAVDALTVFPISVAQIVAAIVWPD
jgi:Uma2 family endonuclease